MNRRRITLLFLILFYPLGIFFMWKNKHFPKIVRILLSSFYGFITLCIIIGNLADDSSSNQAENSKETVTTTVSKVDKPKADKPKVKKIPLKLETVPLTDKSKSLSVIKDYNSDASEVMDINGAVTINISKDKTYWDENSVVANTADDNYKLMYKLLKRSDVKMVTVNAIVPMTDIKGGESTQNGVSVTWTKDTINGMNIENFDPSNFYRVADDYNVYPGILSQLKSTTKTAYFE